jgi:hypothetical protein
MDTERFRKRFKFLEVAIVDTRKGVKSKNLGGVHDV